MNNLGETAVLIAVLVTVLGCVTTHRSGPMPIPRTLLTMSLVPKTAVMHLR